MYLVFLGLVCLGHPCWAACYPKAWVMHNRRVRPCACTVLESANRTLSPLLSLLERLAMAWLKAWGCRAWTPLVPGLSAAGARNPDRIKTA